MLYRTQVLSTPNLEELKQVICSTLPGLSEETLKKLVDGLVAVGVENKADLQFVTNPVPQAFKCLEM
ncbi:hypothetical protein MHYP_G00255240 [Metynnis hypsauchen]